MTIGSPRRGRRGLTDGEALRMREWRARTGDPPSRLASLFGTNITTAYEIIRGRSYRDVGGPIAAGRDASSLEEP